MESLFGDLTNLGDLLEGTFEKGVELFLAEEGEKELRQPRRANACWGRIDEVPFKEEGSDQVQQREVSTPCESNNRPSIDPISWNDLALSLHEGESALKPAEKCECRSLTLPTKPEDLCPGLAFLDKCVGVPPNQKLGISPVNGVCAKCRNFYMFVVKQGKRSVEALKQHCNALFAKRGLANQFLDHRPIVCAPWPPPRREIPDKIFTCDQFCGLCGRSMVVATFFYTTANCDCGENNELSEWAGRIPLNGRTERARARRNLPSKIFPSVLTPLHDAVNEASPVKLSATPHCCE